MQTLQLLRLNNADLKKANHSNEGNYPSFMMHAVISE